VIPLCIDASVPLYNYKPQTTYSSGSNFESFNPFEEPQSMQLPAVIPTPPNPTPNPNPTPPTVVRTVISSELGNMFFSWDGTTWNFNEGQFGSLNAVGYNVFANVWIAGGGTGGAVQSAAMIYSNNGWNWEWSNVPNFQGYCSVLACNGARWIAGCSGMQSYTSFAPSCSFYYSDDNGRNWNTCTTNYVTVFPSCNSLACNAVSKVWIANISNDTFALIISTDDGINWNKLSSSSGGVNVDLFQTVACHGTTWIACSVYANSDVSFHRSTDDGTSWTSSSPTFGKGQTVAFNFACNGANTWVGYSGGSYTSNETLIYSNDDGATWQPSANGNTIFNPPNGDVCNSVAWDDTNGKWVAVGSGISVVAYSTNGIHWTAYDPYDVTSEVATGVAVRPAIVPPLPTPNILTVSGSGHSVIYLDSNGVPGNFHGPQYKDGISGYTVYVFGGSGSFNGTAVPNSTFNVSYLIVGGGGGGGYGANISTDFIGGGGGGAGGLLTNYGSGPTMTLKLNTSYNLTVGIGGAASTNGQNSTFGQLIAVGGGGGGNNGSDGASGGSGGGGGSSPFAKATTPGNGTSGQGYAGGAGNSGILLSSSGGGGGGAGAVGQTSEILVGGDGGIGVSSQITGTPTYYAGGGGGGAGSATDVVSQGGQGGGGNGGNSSVSSSGGFSAGGLPGMTGTGGGGGGGANNGGMGGSGIIIIRFRSYF
jgi:hypothetical protein